MNKQRGFSAVEASASIAVLALLTFLTFTYVTTPDQQLKQPPVASQQADIPTVPTITSTSDLDEAAALLESIDPEAYTPELSVLEADLDSF